MARLIHMAPGPAGRAAWRAGLVLAAAWGAWAGPASATTYEVVRLGLDDALHTAPVPSRNQDADEVWAVNSRGQVVGKSDRYDARGAFAGASTWLFDGRQHVRLGLIDDEHGTSLSEASWADRLNLRGQVAGSTQRSWTRGGGQSAWLYDGASTRRIGLLDGVHVSRSGKMESATTGLNDRGQVIGWSTRYNGDAVGPEGIGRSAWIHDGALTRQIGLLDAGHVSVHGNMRSTPTAINAAGAVAGYASRFDAAGFDDGQSAWVFDGRATRRVGLFDAAHTGRDGLQVSYLVALNGRGQTVGASERLGTSGRAWGMSAWFDDGTSTRRIGLWDGAHARVPGGSRSEVTALNDAGQVIGASWAWGAARPLHATLTYSAWLFDGKHSRPIGLTDHEHRLADGRSSSQATKINAKGQVVGTSFRYNAAGQPADGIYGYSAWWSDGATTTRIGLIDAAHTDIDGRQDSGVHALNDAGHAVGTSARYRPGGGIVRYDSWFYDPGTATTHELSFAGVAMDARYLLADGTVLGTYRAERRGSFTDRLVAWSLGEGYVDLGDAVGAGSGTGDWSQLLRYTAVADGPFITGNGRLKNRELSAFLLRPTTPVPEPATAAMWLAGLVLLGAAARRRRARPVSARGLP